MSNLIDNQKLKEIGFEKQKPIIDEYADDGFNYIVSSIECLNSRVDVVNEYRDGNLTNQFTTINIDVDGLENVSIDLLQDVNNLLNKIRDSKNAN